VVNVHVPNRSKAWPVKTSRGHPSADKPNAITPSNTRGRADGKSRCSPSGLAPGPALGTGSVGKGLSAVSCGALGTYERPG
jgi:hypothetical protein